MLVNIEAIVNNIRQHNIKVNQATKQRQQIYK